MLLIIFGAGSSFDHDDKATKVSNYPRLPLTNDIINSNLQYVQEAMSRWPGSVPILNRLSTVANDDIQTFNLEDALYQESQRKPEAVKAQLLSFKFYVHDIIRIAEYNVRKRNQGNTNYTRLLDRLQQYNSDETMGIALVSFNYDTLLDTACNQLYPMWEFNDFDDYVNGLPNVRLYKPHGSLSWKIIHNMPHISHQLSSVKALLNARSVGLIADMQQITHYMTEHSVNVLGGRSVTEPILALPYKKKTSFVFPKEHNYKLASDMRKVTHILTIGWRGEEFHFHKTFLTEIPDGSQIKILNVNKGGRVIQQNLQRTLKEKIVSMESFSDGFTAFLDNKLLLESFLK